MLFYIAGCVVVICIMILDTKGAFDWIDSKIEYDDRVDCVPITRLTYILMITSSWFMVSIWFIMCGYYIWKYFIIPYLTEPLDGENNTKNQIPKTKNQDDTNIYH